MRAFCILATTLSLLLFTACSNLHNQRLSEPKGQVEQTVTLATNGKTSYQIVIAEKYDLKTKKAAEDLSLYLNKITGATFKVMTDHTKTSDYELCVGDTNRLKNTTVAELGTDGYEVRQIDQTLFFFGGNRRGIFNAVYSFLEEDLGCRWYSAGFEVIPKQSTLSLSPVNRISIPKLKVRDPFTYVSWNIEWALRNKTHIHMPRPDLPKIPKELGGGVKYLDGYFVHTYASQLPKEKFFESHPEYYMMDQTGNRSTHQVCETHPEVAKEIIKKVRKDLAKDPSTMLVSVSKNDGGGTCQCETCKTLNEAEGSDAASMLVLVNRVAKDLEKDYPDVLVTTLAYLETIGLPKTVRPRSNVAIRVCNNIGWNHMLLAAKDDPEFSSHLEDWGKAGAKTFIWDYQADFGKYLIPTPNMEVVASNIRYFIDQNATGIMEQANYKNKALDREWMRSWVQAKLMWNPDLDLDLLINDFIDGFYGPAAPEMHEYNQMMKQLGREKEDMRGHLMNGIRMEIFTKEWLHKAEALMNKAEQKVINNPQFLKHVRELHAGIIFALLEKGPEFVGERYLSLINKMEAYCKQVNIPKLREHDGTLEEYMEKWQNNWIDAEPKISSKYTIFIDALNFEITTLFSNAKIYYTTDGSEPTQQSKRYSAPVKVSETTTIRAAVFVNGKLKSTATQKFEKVVPQKALASTPKNADEYVRNYYLPEIKGGWKKVPDFSKEKPVSVKTVDSIEIVDIPREEMFGATFDGFIEIEETGIYSFWLRSDDGSNLLINGKEVVNHDGLHSAEKFSKRGDVALEKGFHKLHIDYFESFGGEELYLYIQKPNEEKKGLF